MENSKSYYAIIPANVRYDKDLSANAKLLYGEITALCNEKGYCWATNAYFADLYCVDRSTINRWLQQLVKKRYINSLLIYKEGSKEVQERHLSIANTPICKNADTPMQKCDEGIGKNADTPMRKNADTPLCKNARDNITLINNTNINNTFNKKDMSKTEKLEQEFESLWKRYPRKIGKAKAMQSYKKARKTSKTSYEKIEQGLYRYIDYINDREIDEQFIMHGSTWFNQAKWEDEYTCVATNKKPKNALEYYKQKYGGDENEHSRNGEIIDSYSEVIPELF